MAAWVAGAGVGWGVLIAVSAFLIGTPQLLSIDALLVVVAGASAVALLRTMTLSLEGNDVVYRAGSKEKRIPRADIAGCTLANGVWAFTDSAGARLLTLNAVRFNEADVAAFCNQAGISLSGPSQRPVDRLRRDVSSAKWTRGLGIGLGVVLAAAVVGMLYAQYYTQQTLKQYLAAPVCGEGQTPNARCKLEGTATVTSVDQYTGGRTLHLRLAGGGDYRAWLDNPTPNTGDVVDVEVWNGDVRLVNGRKTGTNPTTDPNLNLGALPIVPGLFALVCLGTAAAGQYQLVHARAALRIALGPEAGMAAPVQRVRPDSVPAGVGLPPCGVHHQPKEQFFAHYDRKEEMSGAAILAVIVAIPVAIFIGLAFAFSSIWWAIAAVVGVLFYGEQLIELWAGSRNGGIYADDLHVAKIEANFFWHMRRTVYDRKSILEIRLSNAAMTAVGVDGSTLFLSSLISKADRRRFADFVGGRVVEDAPPQADALAVPPTRTPEGVLPLSYRRAAGLLQAIGGLLLGLGVVNAAVRIPSTPADRRTLIVELLVLLIVYGALYLGAGLLLARGLPASREMALYGGGAATVGVLVALWLVSGNLGAVAFFAVLFVPIFLLVAYWLRQPLPRRDAIR
ncbi:MAG TPA: hypothetical protein VFL29_14790 [Candidatus Dormibacteraeota bacterium]|nr:hypothetical protein [Candidatus Dormibacteraeota bacterium]